MPEATANVSQGTISGKWHYYSKCPKLFCASVGCCYFRSVKDLPLAIVCKSLGGGKSDLCVFYELFFFGNFDRWRILEKFSFIYVCCIHLLPWNILRNCSWLVLSEVRCTVSPLNKWYRRLEDSLCTGVFFFFLSSASLSTMNLRDFFRVEG